MGQIQSRNNAPPPSKLDCPNNGTPSVSECNAKDNCRNMINGIAYGTQTVTTTTNDDISTCLFTPSITTIPCSYSCPCTYSDTPIPIDFNYCSRSSGNPTDGYGYSPGKYLLKNNNDTTRCSPHSTVNGNVSIGNLVCIAGNNFLKNNNNNNSYIVDNGRYGIKYDTFKNIEGFDNSKLRNIEDDNNKFIKDLNIFNQLYYQYVSKCNGKVDFNNQGFCVIKDDNDNRDFNIERKNSSCIADCTTVKTKLNNWFEGYDKSNFNKHINDLTSTTEYRGKNKTIEIKNNDNAKLRNDLDRKLRELYNDPGSLSLNHSLDYDSTIYSGLLITIIASSLIFYAFTKL